MKAPLILQSRWAPSPTIRTVFRQQTRRTLSCACQRLQEIPEGQSFFRRKAAAVAAEYSKDEPTSKTMISPSERQAFQRLQQIAARQQMNTRLGIDAPEQDALDLDPERILKLFTPVPPKPVASASLIDDTSTTDHLFVQETKPTQGPAPVSQTNTSPSEDSSSTATTEEITQQICRGELREYSKNARQALNSSSLPGDFALFGLLESTLVDVLALQNKPKNTKQQKKDSVATDTSTPADESQTARQQPSPAVELLSTTTGATAAFPRPRYNLHSLIKKHVDPSRLSKTPPHRPKVSALEILTRLYPSILLLTLRHLVKSHPLSLQTHRLLPLVRQLGPTSYILGATTPFYNTHLLLRWKVYSSLSEVCGILVEMERGAVEFDRGTAKLLREISEERAADLHDSFSVQDDEQPQQRQQARGKGWWLMPEQQAWWPKVEEWRAVIARRLEEKGLGEVLREGPDLSHGRDEEPMPQVWL